MPRPGPRLIVAMLACAMTVGCTQDSPLESSNPATPPRADLLRSAVRIHVDLARGTAVTVSPDARSATAAGLSLALVGRNELRADVIGPIRRSAIGQFTKKIATARSAAMPKTATMATLSELIVPAFRAVALHVHPRFFATQEEESAAADTQSLWTHAVKIPLAEIASRAA